MRVLFTGASSFTGSWFVRELAARGHQVVATFRGDQSSYQGIRKERVDLVGSVADARFGLEFGSASFLELAGEPFDVLCHHAAEVKDYKSADFDFVGAVGANTRGLRQLLERLIAGGCRRVVATGSVFEPDEGCGEQPRRAFSPYGLSKGLTWEVLKYWAHVTGMELGKFVIPNPFGPYEEPRFTWALVSAWSAGKPGVVLTPDYVRDNIHVSLLAKAYAAFVAGNDALMAPCGYVETQGAFARRFAAAMKDRLGLPCEVQLAAQTAFSEPRIRVNTMVLDHESLSWNEQAAWDSCGDYYRARISRL